MSNGDYLVRKNGKYNGDIKCPVCEEIFEWKEDENADVRILLQSCNLEENTTSGLFIGRNYVIPVKRDKTGEVTFNICVTAKCSKCKHKIEFYEKARYRKE